MYAVSRAFQEAVRADKRRVLGRVTIDYTDPFLDQSITVTASEQARISWPVQTADGVDNVSHKWASLDGSWTLDGSWRLVPDTEDAAKDFQMGWWGNQLAGVGGVFVQPYPTLIMTFDPRPIHTLKVSGDVARGEWPVDFTIRMFNDFDVLLHTETMTGNQDIFWSKPLSNAVLNVAKMELEVSRWSHAGRQAKISEFYSSIQETYEDERIIELSFLEEREADQGSLPIGNISANEISVVLDNLDHRFDLGNTESPLFGLIKANRRLRAWLGVELPDQTVEWVPLGVFWTVDWEVNDSAGESTVRVVARDRLELLRQSTYESSQVAQNVSLYDLAEEVLQDAGLEPGEYFIDPLLQQITVPYAWFNSVSYRDALRAIAEASLAVVYADRDGVVRVEKGEVYTPVTKTVFIEGAPFPAEVSGIFETAYGISPDDYFSLSTPSRQGQLANEIIVDTQPLRPSATTEVYRSNEPIVVPVGQTVNIVAHYNIPPVINASARLEGATDTDILTADFYGWGAEIVLYNAGMADEQVTLIIEGQPLQVQNKERAMTRDEASIRDNGRLRYEFPANHLVQSLPVAQQIADSLLASYKDPRRDVRLEWRGNPALELGDLITVPESPDKTRRGYFVVFRQELTWAGALSAVVEGRRVTSL